ncbi:MULTISPECIES: hypothetical protein [unclassified Pseudomonas]|uniref:hypothetical protein n=1 Tax=unclassified Pseudomonas TaxID=196821 RepID=UPI000BC389DB|nr:MULTISPECIES: hypothetical protein [unclassified Pseudomonas]PVZ16420.1 hypothetical protein F474_01940 [Pseudomonas sp. URIL14HWK12:I12]PVZ25724.1 hypothetical protein F470_01170 [Pseudomonas sp. URIL14HWK12:I10]PVZ36752.1 hypothetical protein F472_01940 [Pseudomonas sp. URIL14HWK12:I11]SNZ12684.1 hypothetical protein SAMN05660463_02147 [Pseudomonas sp. URIL14HWK12:I9]
MNASLIQKNADLEPDLKQWFDEASRTFGWDLVMMLDRKSINQILLQDYIARFDAQSYLPPMSGVPESGEGELTELVGLRYDLPRLSFDEVDLSDPTATLRMRLIGGVRLQWNTSGAVRKLRSISYLSPINTDVLEQPVNLRSASASSVGNQIVLDLGSGAFTENIPKARLHCGLTGKARRAVGAWTAHWLSERPPALKEYILTELKETELSLFRPRHIRLLTQVQNPRSVRGADDHGEGAVLAFVALEGGQTGTLPSRRDVTSGNWKYLLGGRGGYSSCWIFDRVALIRLIMSNTFSGEITGPNSTVAASNPGTLIKRSYTDYTGIQHIGVSFSTTSSLHFDYRAVSHQPGSAWDTLWGKFSVPLYEKDEYNNVYGVLSWAITGMLQTGQLERFKPGAWGSSKYVVMDYKKLDTQGRVAIGYDFEMLFACMPSVQDGAVEFGPVASWVSTKTPEVPPSELSRLAQKAVFDEIREVISHCFLAAAENINTIVRRNVLFSGSQAITLDAFYQSHDVVLAGHLDYAFTIDIQEALIDVGTQLQLRITAQKPVEWRASLIEGSASDVGYVDEQGLYHSAGAISGAYARVRISARSGDYVTYALITVSAAALQISPAVQLVTAGSLARYFIRGGSTAAWSWDTAALKGQLVAPVPEPGEHFEEGEMQYIPPGTAEVGGNYLVDTVRIRSENKTSSADIFVLNGTELYTLKIKRYLPDESAELSVFDAAGREVNVPLFKAAGGGTLNGNIVSSGVAPDKPYIIVMALTDIPSIGVFYGVLLLPLPLSVLDNTASRAALMGEPLKMPTFVHTPGGRSHDL